MLSTHRVATAIIKMTLVVVFASAIFAAPTQPPAQPGVANVGIVYDGPDLPLAEGYLGAHYIGNLLGHFRLRGELIRLAEYRPDQLAHYSAAFYVGSVKKKSLAKEFLKDVRYSRQPFCWLGQNIDQLLAGSGAQRQFGLRYLGYQQNRTPLVASLPSTANAHNVPAKVPGSQWAVLRTKPVENSSLLSFLSESSFSLYGVRNLRVYFKPRTRA